MNEIIIRNKIVLNMLNAIFIFLCLPKLIIKELIIRFKIIVYIYNIGDN